ncbi:hypothetical protein KUTeg_023290 [Tegillarca granosa]|uniref:C-type lectin domain-containing protein n=1 Tax=Tegillarca granosa TaxID=220873 RepID=A0ABQ9E6Y5_TEGGR|nr:hypothetical protein KUTeg_023290 [Tegillarca granosa]
MTYDFSYIIFPFSRLLSQTFEEKRCRQYGYLATVDEEKISSFLKSILLDLNKPLSFWIGLYTHLNKQNNFQWIATKERYQYSEIKDASPEWSCSDLTRPNSCVQRNGFICQINFDRKENSFPFSLCPHGWFEKENTCFYISGFEALWPEAWHYCRLYDHANLVTIDSRKVDEFLQPILLQMSSDYQQDSFWIGLKRNVVYQYWVWTIK